MRFIGIDLHHDSFVAAFLHENGQINTRKYFLTNGKGLIEFLGCLHKEDYMAVEASTNTFWFYGQVVSKVKECFIINTSRFSIISRSNKKTDKIDARKIAMKLRYKVISNCTEDEFPTVYVPEMKVQELRTLFTTYELISEQNVTIQNRIYSLFVQQGYCLERKTIFNNKTREAVFNLTLPETTKIQLHYLFKEYDFLLQQKKDLKNVILKEGKYFDKEIDKLISIRGISVFTAIAIMTDIADIKRFSSSKKLCAYLRTAPKIDSSNTSEKIGCVNKQSRKLALKMVLQGLHHVYKSSPYLLRFYINKCKGKKAGKVRIAIARKLFQGIYHMLKNDTYFYWADFNIYKRKKEEYGKILKKFPKSA